MLTDSNPIQRLWECDKLLIPGCNKLQYNVWIGLSRHDSWGSMYAYCEYVNVCHVHIPSGQLDYFQLPIVRQFSPCSASWSAKRNIGVNIGGNLPWLKLWCRWWNFCHRMSQVHRLLAIYIWWLWEGCVLKIDLRYFSGQSQVNFVKMYWKEMGTKDAKRLHSIWAKWYVSYICIIHMNHSSSAVPGRFDQGLFTRASCPAKFWSPKSRIRKTGTPLLSLDLWLMIWSEKKTWKNCQNAIQNLRACRIEHKLRPTIPMARNYGNKLWLCRSRPGNPIVESWGKGSIGLQCPHLNDLNVVRYNSNQLNLEIQWNIMKFTKKHEVGIPNDSTRTAFS